MIRLFCVRENPDTFSSYTSFAFAQIMGSLGELMEVITAFQPLRELRDITSDSPFSESGSFRGLRYCPITPLNSP